MDQARSPRRSAAMVTKNATATGARRSGDTETDRARDAGNCGIEFLRLLGTTGVRRPILLARAGCGDGIIARGRAARNVSSAELETKGCPGSAP
jgi:hypothetical protein